MKLIAPSILTADFSNLSLPVRYAEMGGADMIHCDIMDGHFVPNITFGPVLLKAIKKITKLPLDVHLMIEDPDKYIDAFAKNGAGIITVHQETCVHLNRTVQHIKEAGVKAGITINPSTPVSMLEEIAEYADLILIMSVNPGFGGQKFLESSIRKIRETVQLRNRLNADFLIEVDGGINTGNIKNIANAGCDVFVIGSAIFNHENIAAATTEFKNLVNTALA